MKKYLLYTLLLAMCTASAWAQAPQGDDDGSQENEEHYSEGAGSDPGQGDGDAPGQGEDSSDHTDPGEQEGHENEEGAAPSY